MSRPQLGLVTASEIDPSKPAAVFSNGKWINVTDFLATQNFAANNHSGASSRPTPFQLKQIQNNPSMFWTFEGENKVFENHDILNAIFDKMYANSGSQERMIDEYGYRYTVPGAYEYKSGGNSMVIMPTKDESGKVASSIQSEDFYSSFRGLTLNERDVFWSEMQNIFDKHGLNIDARKQDYGFTPSGIEGCGDATALGGWNWQNSELKTETVKTIQNEIKQNATLNRLFEKADKLLKGEIPDDTLAQQYSIRVTDDDGNRLANDRIIIEAKNGNSVEISVNDFKQMDRKAISLLLQ